MASRVSLTTPFYRFPIDWIIRIISQVWGHRSCDCLVLGPGEIRSDAREPQGMRTR